MRSLTIKRAKRYVASLTKMKVYIEDPEYGDLTINGAPCRKLGELKNGEEATFEIGEDAAKVYVIADKLTRGYCNDYYQLEAGAEDIYLTGRNDFDLGSGNAFRFDNNANGPDETQKKKSRRTGLIVTIAAALVGAVLGYLIVSGLHSAKAAAPKTFTAEEMSITLTKEFSETDAGDFTAVFESNEAVVLAVKEPFSLGEGFGDLTLDEYVDIAISSNGIKNAEKKDLGGVPGFTYTYDNPNNNESYKYYVYTYKLGDAFWMIQFASLEKDAEKLAPQFAEWAKTISFAHAQAE